MAVAVKGAVQEVAPGAKAEAATVAEAMEVAPRVMDLLEA